MVDPIPDEILERKAHLVQALACGIGWLVSVDDVLKCNTREELIHLHLETMKCPMVLSKRVLQYPDKVIDALSCIRDQYVLSRLLQFIATQGKSMFDDARQRLHHAHSGNVLFLLFTTFYKHQFKNQQYDEKIISDYCQLATDCNELPNLRIKSYKRMVAEHNKLMQNVNDENVPEFEMDDAQMMPDECEGYLFTCITSKQMLIQEAEEMQHCVASYGDKIAAGLSIIYKISGLERATMELIKENGIVAIEQIYGFRNQPVSDALNETVRKFFKWTEKPEEPDCLAQLNFDFSDIPF